ncbi:unnamed protein product [Allacma fusca]|uniref:Uncharacterized protein n=1 Tax=Allacma fusca TaxID=39272 RepID=A0A8J2PB68_9HEXA|nr:unnamed protein product [Allacma fusca]
MLEETKKKKYYQETPDEEDSNRDDSALKYLLKQLEGLANVYLLPLSWDDLMPHLLIQVSLKESSSSRNSCCNADFLV